MIAAEHQAHLDHAQRVNLGAYYTERRYVDIVWRMLIPHLTKNSVIVDSSCGYGAFLRPDMPYTQIGGDIDAAAIQSAREKHKENDVSFYVANALQNVDRARYHIKESAHLCVIGNPPYNDRTSLVRSGVKRGGPTMDPDIRARDLGLSFILSYQKLRADIVCVLHPLSYLVKRANFRRLKTFTAEYRLIDGKIISSGVFSQTSQTTHFPILIALYKKGMGLSYQDVLDFDFEVVGGETFTLSRYDDISRYVRKYPDKNQKPRDGDIFFWTLRDINALKRNRAFVGKFSAHAIIVDPRLLDYYVYIDVFKQYARHVPYYFGNCDALIDDDLFGRRKKHFIIECLSRRPQLRPRYPGLGESDAAALALARQKISQYFRQLLRNHYVD